MRAIFSERLARPVGPFSPAVEATAATYIFVSGQIGQAPATGKLVDGGVAAETEQTFANLAAILNAVDRFFPDHRSNQDLFHGHVRFRDCQWNLCQVFHGTIPGTLDDRCGRLADGGEGGNRGSHCRDLM